MSEERKIRAEKSVVFTDLDDGSGVLLNLENKYYYSLNMTASFIWHLLEENEELSKEEILKAILENFDITEEQAKKDVNEFIDNLAKEGLISLD